MTTISRAVREAIGLDQDEEPLFWPDAHDLSDPRSLAYCRRAQIWLSCARDAASPISVLYGPPDEGSSGRRPASSSPIIAARGADSSTHTTAAMRRRTSAMPRSRARKTGSSSKWCGRPLTHDPRRPSRDWETRTTAELRGCFKTSMWGEDHE